MELIRGLNNWRQPRGCVATIGNFDGVHIGHQAIFRELVQQARSQNLPALVISFAPLPHEFFNPQAQHQRVQTLRDRVSAIEQCGIDHLLLLRFNQKLAGQSAADFIQQTLNQQLGVKHLFVGDDFRFGANRSGDVNLLRSDGLFTVADTPTIELESARVSSTRLRALLKQGNCQEVASLLGRAYRISGRVVHGEKIGRQLGFPTANVALKKHRPLLRGVFAVTAKRPQCSDNISYPAVANLGERPTVGGRKLLLEVHLLQQSFDLYGERLAIDFHHFIRGEKKFDSLDQLKQAISDDAATAGRYLASMKGDAPAS